MNISIVGLGLMGGSIAMALKGFGERIIGVETDERVCAMALECGAVDTILPASEAFAVSNLVIFCVYPATFLKLFDENKHCFKDDSIVADICGVKVPLYSQLKDILDGFDKRFDVVGIHPMAGKEVDGFENACGDLFKNTGFITVPLEDTKPESVELMQKLGRHIGATRFAVADAQKHDDIIGYTSDLMHISAAMLCLNYHKELSPAFTAGAFRDCTRIANINASLWTELLLANGDAIIPHLDAYIGALTEVRETLKNGDETALFGLLLKAGDNKRGIVKL